MTGGNSVAWRRDALDQRLKYLDSVGVVSYEQGYSYRPGEIRRYVIVPVAGSQRLLTLSEAEEWVGGAIAAVDALRRKSLQEKVS